MEATGLLSCGDWEIFTVLSQLQDLSAAEPVHHQMFFKLDEICDFMLLVQLKQ